MAVISKPQSNSTNSSHSEENLKSTSRTIDTKQSYSPEKSQHNDRTSLSRRKSNRSIKWVISGGLGLTTIILLLSSANSARESSLASNSFREYLKYCHNIDTSDAQYNKKAKALWSEFEKANEVNINSQSNPFNLLSQRSYTIPSCK
ncbi:MAG: hypothetical protein ACK53E_10485 [Pseudanabaena sp.]